jgi:hypothetical protein
VDHLFNSSEKRVERVLLLLANHRKDSKPEPVIAKISQETWAEMVGTTRQNFMNRCRKLGFIHYNGGLTYHQFAAESSMIDASERGAGARTHTSISMFVRDRRSGFQIALPGYSLFPKRVMTATGSRQTA